MSREDVERFIASGITRVTIVFMRGEDFTDPRSQPRFYTVGYVKEISGIVATSDSWLQEDLQKEIEISYFAMQKYFEKKA